MTTYAAPPPPTDSRQRRRDGRPESAPTTRPRDPLWARLSIVLGAVVMVVSGLVVVKIAMKLQTSFR